MTARITLGTIIEDFSNVALWVLTGTGATHGTDTIYHKEGNASVWMQNTTANMYIQRDHGSLVDMSAGDTIFVHFHVHGDAGLTPGGITTMRIAFIEDSGVTKYFQFAFNSPGSLAEGDYCIAVKKPAATGGRWDVTGAADWSRIRYVSLFVDPFGTDTVKISWLGIRMGYSATPWIVLTCDDGFTTDYTIVKPLVESYGWHFSSYVILSKFGLTNLMTRAQCDAIYGAGHDICNHTATHGAGGLIALDQSALAAEIDTPYETLMSYGYTRSAKHFAYPYGSSNSTVVDAVRINHLTGRRFHTPDMFAHPDLLSGGQYLIPGKDIAEANWATRSAEIIEAVEAGRPYFCTWHQITNQANLESMLAGIAALQTTYPTLRVGSTSEYYNWLAGFPEPDEVSKDVVFGDASDSVGTLVPVKKYLCVTGA